MIYNNAMPYTAVMVASPVFLYRQNMLARLRSIPSMHFSNKYENVSNRQQSQFRDQPVSRSMEDWLRDLSHMLPPQFLQHLWCLKPI